MPIASLLSTLAPYAIRGAGMAVDAVSPEARAERKQLRADMQALQRGTLGPSQAERRQMQAAALASARAANRANVDALARQAAANPGQAAALQGALQQTNQQATAAAAQAAGQIEVGAAGQAAAQKADILRRIREKRAQRVAGFSDLARATPAEAEADDFTSLLHLMEKK